MIGLYLVLDREPFTILYRHAHGRIQIVHMDHQLPLSLRAPIQPFLAPVASLVRVLPRAIWPRLHDAIFLSFSDLHLLLFFILIRLVLPLFEPLHGLL